MKIKKDEKELAKERQEKIDEALNKFDLQLTQIKRKKNVVLQKVIEARDLGLPDEEAQARVILGKCIAQEKRVYKMKMQLELHEESRNVSNLEQLFIDTISEMSIEIEKNATKKGVAKAKKKYLKSLFNISQQNDRIDDFLSEGDAALDMDSSVNQNYNKYDDEIDKMIVDAELKERKDPQKNKY